MGVAFAVVASVGKALDTEGKNARRSALGGNTDAMTSLCATERGSKTSGRMVYTITVSLDKFG